MFVKAGIYSIWDCASLLAMLTNNGSMEHASAKKVTILLAILADYALPLRFTMSHTASAMHLAKPTKSGTQLSAPAGACLVTT